MTLVDTNALDLGGSTVSGTLSVTTGGAITDSGAVVVTGTATFAAGCANSITLDNANDFSTVVITSSNNVIINDINGLDLGTCSVCGTLGVTTAGPITDSGAIVVAGTATFAAGAANDITLNTAANDFNSITVTFANDVTLVDTNAVTLTSIVTSGGGSVDVTSGGNMTVNVVNAGTGAITLTTTGAGSILDGNGAANNLTAGTNSTLNAGGTIGTALKALDVVITGATLTVGAGGIDTGVSINIDGTVTPSNTLNVPVFPPGQVLFNGNPITPPTPPTPPTPINSAMLLDIYNPINHFIDWFDDEEEGEGDPFIHKQRWSIAYRTRFLD
ncbi:MAG: hypothetical protein HZC17_01605 [Candidatus Omnitrophica bacterium]|nr:hypothetical protein [Candidatus Omnitrophota bacterium]